ncbi:hypothetical protein [Candidatus Methanodesulfokora washburnensis]|uniref:Uncharacterized protein n=1 Tax=Candidatus Methanodesulfokora washburnensis TaxID=2478471 RepID=A0A429GI96_9CREN|nr:hypothetical protein [Candidatus Methanodesulfokores washburnensis]RSN73389.1 hypothetical protein D6D85_10610 [Candidatus Methanodesulfokores washburnensis]
MLMANVSSDSSNLSVIQVKAHVNGNGAQFYNLTVLHRVFFNQFIYFGEVKGKKLFIWIFHHKSVIGNASLLLSSLRIELFIPTAKKTVKKGNSTDPFIWGITVHDPDLSKFYPLGYVGPSEWDGSAASKIASAGIKMVRFMVFWGDIEREWGKYPDWNAPWGSYPWAFYDKAIEDMVKNNLTPLLIVGAGYAWMVPWIDGKPIAPHYGEGDVGQYIGVLPDEYIKHVTEAARRIVWRYTYFMPTQVRYPNGTPARVLNYEPEIEVDAWPAHVIFLNFRPQSYYWLYPDENNFRYNLLRNLSTAIKSPGVLINTGREEVLVIDAVSPPATGIFGKVIETHQEPGWGRAWVWTFYNPSITSYYFTLTTPNPDPSAGDKLDLRYFNPYGRGSYVIYDMGRNVSGIRVYPTQDHLGRDIRTGQPNYDRKNFYDVEYHEYDVYVSSSSDGPWIKLNRSTMWLEGYAEYPAIADDGVKDYFSPTPFRYVKITPFLDIDCEVDAVEILEAPSIAPTATKVYFDFSIDGWYLSLNVIPTIALDLKGKGLVDYMAVNSYMPGWILAPSANQIDGLYASAIVEITALRAASSAGEIYGATSTPTIIGETGWATTYGFGLFGEYYQELFIERVVFYSLRGNSATGGKAPFGLIIHRYKDLDISKPHPFVCSFYHIEYTFGLLRKDGTEKLGWYAYQRAIRS